MGSDNFYSTMRSRLDDEQKAADEKKLQRAHQAVIDAHDTLEALSKLSCGSPSILRAVKYVTARVKTAKNVLSEVLDGKSETG